MSQNHILLLGLDFGSTTSSAIIIQAIISEQGIKAVTEFGEEKVLYRSTPVFTPFNDSKIDEVKIHQLLDSWLAESQIAITNLFAAGVIITGLAALQSNVEAIRQLVLQKIPAAAIVAADDPHLESWLAFMGSCATLSRYHAHAKLLNLDIGGGTTNAAIGISGNVLTTGCHFIGARHFQFIPGSYQLAELSRYGVALLASLNIHKTLGDALNASECADIMAFYIKALEAIVLGDSTFFDAPIAKLYEQASCPMDAQANPAITFSGGVGELVYQLVANQALPSTTYYGDFGIDLAHAIVASPVLSRNLKSHVPENLGRATVYGLALNSTEVSGSSIYLTTSVLTGNAVLPLRDLPILAKLAIDAPAEAWLNALKLINQHNKNCALQITHQGNISLNTLKGFAHMLSAALLKIDWQPMLVLLINGNIGKTLGNYITNWGKHALHLIVIDEVSPRDAHFVNLGVMQQGVIPVSFYGLY